AQVGNGCLRRSNGPGAKAPGPKKPTLKRTYLARVAWPPNIFRMLNGPTFLVGLTPTKILPTGDTQVDSRTLAASARTASRRACDRAGIALADKGVDLPTIQEWWGHRSIEMTVRYYANITA